MTQAPINKILFGPPGNGNAPLERFDLYKGLYLDVIPLCLDSGVVTGNTIPGRMPS